MSVQAKPTFRPFGINDRYDDQQVPAYNAIDAVVNYANVFGDHDIVTRIDPNERRPFTRLTNEQIFEKMASRYIGEMVRDFAEDTSGWWFVLAPMAVLETDSYTGTITTVLPTLADAAPPYSTTSVVEMKEESYSGHLTAWGKSWTVKGSSLQFAAGRKSLGRQVGEVVSAILRRAKERVEIALRNSKNKRQSFNILTTRPKQSQNELERRNNRFYLGLLKSPTFMQELITFADDVMKSEGNYATEIILPYKAMNLNYFARITAATYDHLIDESASDINSSDKRLQPTLFGRNIWRSANWSHIQDGMMRGDFLTHPSTTARTALISPSYAADFVGHPNFNAHQMQSIQVHDMTNDLDVTVSLLNALRQSARFETNGDIAKSVINFRDGYAALVADGKKINGAKWNAQTGEWIVDTMMWVETDRNNKFNPDAVHIALTLGDLAEGVLSLELQTAMATGLYRTLKNGNGGTDLDRATVDTKLGQMFDLTQQAIKLPKALLSAAAAAAASSGASPITQSTAGRSSSLFASAAAANAGTIAPVSGSGGGGSAGSNGEVHNKQVQKKRKARAALLFGEGLQAAFNYISELPNKLSTIEALIDPSRGNTLSPYGVLHYDFVTLKTGDVVLSEAGAGNLFVNLSNVRSHYDAEHDVVKGTAETRMASHFPDPSKFIVVRNVSSEDFQGGMTTKVVKSKEEYQKFLKNKTHLRGTGGPSGFFFLTDGNLTLESMPSNRYWLTGSYDPSVYSGFNVSDPETTTQISSTDYYSALYQFYTINAGISATPYSLAIANNLSVIQTCGFLTYHRRPTVSGGYNDDVPGSGPLPAKFSPKMLEFFSGAHMAENAGQSAIAY